MERMCEDKQEVGGVRGGGGGVFSQQGLVLTGSAWSADRVSREKVDRAG